MSAGFLRGCFYTLTILQSWTGVAPKATLRVYKITGCKNQNIIVDTLIQADLKAYEDGADIISTSIGDTTGWAQNPWTVVTERIAAKGVFIITAAGNTGLKGAFDFSGGSSGPVCFTSQLPNRTSRN